MLFLLSTTEIQRNFVPLCLYLSINNRSYGNKEKRQKRHKSVNFLFSKPVFFYKTPPLPRADGKAGVLILREDFSRQWPDGCRQYRTQRDGRS